MIGTIHHDYCPECGNHTVDREDKECKYSDCGSDERKNKIDRCLAIEREYDNTPAPYVSFSSMEDCDDAYQEKLEHGWWQDEIKAEYEQINVELGYPKRRLYPKDKRRIK